ncbi:lactoylglutathione lyase [Paraburkholderia ginsengiterrae]|uniref:Lactoylglutathione lyase n=1 Tax=Paraburkholderia ginsengiterrae TaxID=1462993 RepID=A0A1A9N313_9BURK|nr:VOC family protein [Paraburkholderia ginsengiterrae]OAJ56834.1 lactoylglutathione lyase [Paraburkholderia ginsengiterrae]OAJ56895.1 lactoylglutathione lyase [Paraburkholderia ginsengiterrae]
MFVSITRLILYVRDVAVLKSFYRAHFDLPLTEEIEDEWAVLKAGEIEIALHRVGEPYRNRASAPNSSNSKIVFSLQSGLPELREKLVKAGVPMRDLKRYDGFPYLMCDGEDPEGNVFQLSQAD